MEPLASNPHLQGLTNNPYADTQEDVHIIALLEEEKLDHMKDIQQGREKVIHLEEEIENLKAESLDLKNLKLSLEIKTVDLEEQIYIRGHP